MMANLNDYRRLLRMEQWYKNLLVFLPLLFSDAAREGWGLLLAFVGFCCVSSVTYITNDWVDRKEDRLHPTKKFRPLASGAITGRQAELVAIALSLVVIVLGFYLGPFYWWPILIYFVATNLYSFWLKHIPILDITMIAGNFMLRMLGGMTAWPVWSEWIPFIFVFALMLMFLSHKRRSDIKLLGKEKAIAHKPVLRFYKRPLAYAIRWLMYFVMLWALWKLGLVLVDIAAVLAVLLVTSWEFVKEPRLVMKPHQLLMRPQWVLVVILSLGVVFLT